MPRVPAKRTSYSSRATFARDVICAAIENGLSIEAGRLIAAHAAHETGWGSHLWGYNLSGMKGAPHRACPPLDRYPVDNYPNDPTDYQTPPNSDWGFDYQCLKTFEIVNGRTVKVRAPFRIFGSMTEGVAAMLKILRKPRYSLSYAMLLAGDRRYFAQVGADGWYTADQAVVNAKAGECYAWIISNLPDDYCSGGVSGADVGGGGTGIGGGGTGIPSDVIVLVVAAALLFFVGAAELVL